VSVSYPLPGTKFYEQVREQLGEKTNWVDSDDLSVMFRGRYANEFYRALRDALHAEVGSWSQQAHGKNGSGYRMVNLESAGPDEVGRLWEIVSQMEKECRSAEAAR
jgi:hypothetical protein